MQPFISVIIPTFKRDIDLLHCLTELNKQLHLELKNNFEIIVTDDGHSFDLKNALNNSFIDVKYLLGPQKGPAANRNFGAQNAIGNWLIFLDDDCIPQDGFLLAYLELINSSNYNVIEGKTISNQPKKRYDEVAPINENGGKLWSCNFAIKKNTFFEVGCFDENFLFATMEDIDLKSRLIKFETLFFCSNAIVIHPWRRRVAFANFKNRIKSQKYFIKKSNTKTNLNFKIGRLKILIGDAVFGFKNLASYSFRGWKCYIDKLVFNFILIFI